MHSIRTKFLPGLMVLTILSFSAVAFVPAAIAAPATYTVNVASDESDALVGDGICETANVGECTLRAAIEEANNNVDPDTIEFNIPGGGVKTISIGSDLPPIANPLVIDAYTQPGSVVNTAISPLPLNNVINIGINAQGSSDSALGIISDDVTIKGISIYNCDVCIYSSNANTSVVGNYIGLDPTGLSVGNALSGHGVKFGTSGQHGSTIGTSIAADRNTIVSNIAVNIAENTSDIEVYGNYLGLGKDGITDFGIDQGIFVLFANDITIGGPATGQANVLSGSVTNQLVGVFSNGIVIQGNLIGTDYTGAVNPNIENGAGIGLEISSNNSIIGGVNQGEGNLVAGVSGLGIGVISGQSTAFGGYAPATDIAILGNSISEIGAFAYPNFGDSNQGLDNLHLNANENGEPTSFENQGVTENDPNDIDEGANDYINFPVLKSAVQTGTNLNVTFDLVAAGASAGDYRIEFFANDESTIFGHGPGQTYLDSVVAQNGSDIAATLAIPNGLDIVGKSLSATATAIKPANGTGFGSTSEFAQNILVGSATDFDSDTISDVVEDGAPNSGDGNDDGIADSLQPTVTSFVSATSGDYTTFVTSGCSSNGYVTSIAQSSLDATDVGFSYPYGLTDFRLNCSRGDTVTIDKYIFTPETDTSDLSVRKYRPVTEIFEAVLNSSVVSENIGGEHALHLNYSIQDGGALDDDSSSNGIIVDPAGLAQVFTESQTITTPTTTNSTSSVPGLVNAKKSASGTLSSTGANSESLFNLGFATLLVGFAIFALTRKKVILKA